MKLVRIGNDVGIAWSVYVNEDGTEVPFDLTGRDLTLFIETGKNRYKITDFTVNTNTVSFVFQGKDQVACGAYILTLIENLWKENQMVLDVKEGFMLVRHTWDTGGVDGPNLETQTVELFSNIGTMIEERLIPPLIARVSYVDSQDAALMEDVVELLSGKVDKVEGKGLSTNDFTDALKAKLEGINLAPYALIASLGSYDLISTSEFNAIFS